MSLEKKYGAQKPICKLMFNEKEIVNLKEIAKKICNYYETLFRKQSPKFEIKTKLFLDNVMTLILYNKQINLCKKEFSKESLYKAIKYV